MGGEGISKNEKTLEYRQNAQDFVKTEQYEKSLFALKMSSEIRTKTPNAKGLQNVKRF